MNIHRKIFKNLVLKPLSFTWEGAYRVRRSFYEYGILKKNYFKVPIISVGNISFGGTGKTPIIIWLNEQLENLNLNTMVLTRGYKGKLENSSGLIKGGERFRSNPKEYGDEPLLISRKMKRGAVVVGKRRSQNLKRYFYQVLPDVVLLDDGFQHIQLYRSFNILLFDALLPLSRYKTAPMGYLREGLTALKDADAVLISRADQASEHKLEQLLQLLSPHLSSEVTIAKFRYRPCSILDCFDREVLKLEELQDKPVIALTAIASPESFYKMLEGLGANIIEKVSFSDHYFFSQEDINELLFKCIQNSATLITSEKDMVKIRRVSQDARINYISIKVDFVSGEEELLQKVEKVVRFD